MHREFYHQGIGVLAGIHYMTKEVLAEGVPGLLVLIQAQELACPLILTPNHKSVMIRSTRVRTKVESWYCGIHGTGLG